MTVPQFSRPGAIDLSALRKPPPAASTAGRGAGAAAGTGAFSFDVVGEQSLRVDVVDRSLSVVVIVSFWSQQSAPSMQLNATLDALADDFGGRFVFAKVDVGSQPELAEALGIPEVPLVVAALRGQLAPLIQEPIPEAEMRVMLDQVLQAAVANGIAGVAEPLGPPEPVSEAADEPAISQHVAAEEALLSGDLDTAVVEYEKVLAVSPADAEALEGLARASLLRRTRSVDLEEARQAAADRPDDVDSQTLMADLDLLGGSVEDAFSRLIEAVRRTSGPERDALRKHLVELFGVVGEQDPRVAKARQALASALF
ncbi:MAG: co-chaperone YbbN [Nocardioidaceae bacterium]